MQCSTQFYLTPSQNHFLKALSKGTCQKHFQKCLFAFTWKFKRIAPQIFETFCTWLKLSWRIYIYKVGSVCD